ncbi:hypothetical protein [Nitrosomonas halophila]|uniref:Uncharacterized protein n=1 Tax=Nitrosomonas halophila TaxID=44576 RepID=A0A1H3L1X3_9PROT|nr:hypothetical protein [Nitrosomonas halophila]SDY58246.1 hypothetical protein SAMN05421881_104423 [Nitrosomonas halophila]
MLLHDAGQYANTHCFFQNRGQSPWLPAKQSYLRAGWMDGWMDGADRHATRAAMPADITIAIR